MSFESGVCSSIPPTRTGDGEHAMRKTAWAYVLIGATAALFMYFHLFQFPLTPIEHGGDQYIFLDHAQRMLHGAVIYQDFFNSTCPVPNICIYFSSAVLV